MGRECSRLWIYREYQGYDHPIWKWLRECVHHYFSDKHIFFGNGSRLDRACWWTSWAFFHDGSTVLVYMLTFGVYWTCMVYGIQMVNVWYNIWGICIGVNVTIYSSTMDPMGYISWTQESSHAFLGGSLRLIVMSNFSPSPSLRTVIFPYPFP